MGACTMRCSLKLLVPAVMILAAPAVGLAQSQPRQPPRFNVGTPLSQDEIKSFDFMLGPEGKELPPGHGSAKEGAAIFAKRCQVCHGQNGEGGAVRRLVLGSPGTPYRGTFKDTERSAISYYPYATTVWDYIHRAMPASNPGSLTPDEIYSVVAFLFYRNGIIQENDVLDEKSLPKVEMPNRRGFVPEVPVYPPEKKPSWY
jgi:S-disulfanyl-L-cysteine oxidoreductase SoxD